jgi:copper(I)-binding protein
MKNQIMHALLSITLTAALATAVTAAPNDTNSASLSVANAYVRAMPPGQSKTVGFLEITSKRPINS